MEKLSFDSFTKKIYIKTTPQKLYWCWATSEGICSWFLREAEYISPEGQPRKAEASMQTGDDYIWGWHNWDALEKGKVMQANGSDFLEISFTDSKVSVHIENQGKVCLLTLRQYDIPTDEQSRLNIHYGCSNGWTFWLANLKAYLEHGILLNETERDLRDIPLAGFEFVNL
ncbi:SRPBCC domain-containing protein [Ulvibacterium sp.]|uniref:SRPBCC family protein n=1 Tax=Ulvibacterium sp. TaxID=2665914 RepID=UPI00262FB4BA|nr:SRPBCC domain-containing protein [Ulvibacterium sp.]